MMDAFVLVAVLVVSTGVIAYHFGYASGRIDGILAETARRIFEGRS